MNINYDPDQPAGVTEEQCREALAIGLFPINVICDPPGAEVGEHVGVSFIVFTAAIPRVGELIHLQDGTICQVQRVRYRVSPGHFPGSSDNLLQFSPNVYAVANGKPQ